MSSSLTSLFSEVTKLNPNEPEFLQAVEEFLTSVVPFIEKHDNYKADHLLQRLIEPERVIILEFHGWMMRVRCRLFEVFV